jgi:hypothetical protein
MIELWPEISVMSTVEHLSNMLHWSSTQMSVEADVINTI